MQFWGRFNATENVYREQNNETETWLESSTAVSLKPKFLNVFLIPTQRTGVENNSMIKRLSRKCDDVK